MELLQLKYFKKVAEVGKISAAAEELFISAPALSAAISRLERDLGIPLFDRSNNKITLNTQGQIFLEGVNQVFHTIQSTKEAMNQSLLQQKKQQLSLALVSSTQWVDLVAAFSQQYPDVTLSCTDISRAELEVGGLPNQYDFLLAVQDSIPSMLVSEIEEIQLLEDHPVIMVNAKHPLAQRESVDIRELAEDNLFLPMKGYPVYSYLADLFHEAGMVLPAGNAYSHLTAQQMAAKGLGVGFSSLHTVRISAPGLCYVPIVNKHRPWKLCLYWRKDHALGENALSFVEFAKKYCTTHSSEHNMKVMQDESFL